MPTVIELGQTVKEKRAELIKIVTEAPKAKGADGAESPSLTADQFTKIATLRDEIDADTKTYQAAKFAEQAAKDGWTDLDPEAPIAMPGGRPSKSFLDTLAESGYKSAQEGNRKIHLETGAKALLTTAGTGGSGIAPVPDRADGVVDLSEVKPTGALSLIPVGAQTDATSVSYVRETTAVNAATTVKEGATKPEATLTFETVNTPIPTIAVWIPATRQQLKSVAGMRGLIENRLGKMVNGRLEQQVYTGNGETTGNLQNMVGIYNTPGVIAPPVLAAPPANGPALNLLDQILPAISAVETSSVDGSVVVNGIVVNPADFYTLVGAKDSQGRYLFGDPSQMAGKRFFGVEGRTSSAFASGTGLVGDFDYSAVRYREEIETYVSDSHDLNFIKNILVFLVELSAIVEVYRSASFSRLAPRP